MPKRKTKVKTNTNQAWGVFLLGLGLLLFITIATFDISDPVNLNVDDNPVNVKNWLGPLGASLSYVLMQWTLGYPILVLPLLIMLLGLRKISTSIQVLPIKINWLIGAWALVLSILLALPEAIATMGKMTEYYPSGLIGGVIASKMMIYLGEFGSLSTLVLLTLVLMFASLPFNLTKLIDSFGTFGLFISSFLSRTSERHHVKRAKRAEEKRLKQIVRESEPDPGPVTPPTVQDPIIHPSKPLEIKMGEPLANISTRVNRTKVDKLPNSPK